MKRLEWHVVTPEEELAASLAPPVEWIDEPDPCPAVEAGDAEPGTCSWQRLGLHLDRMTAPWRCETCGDRTD